MTTLYYPRTPSLEKPKDPVELPPFAPMRMRDPAGYIPDEGLVDAVNVALVLRQPLLLTGEPGTGKSELAASVAWELGLGRPLVFESKSTSQAKELFYVYDTLGRFAAREPRPAKDYLTLSALGEAIVRTRPREEITNIVPTGFELSNRCRTVVLLDEIEKAPRDFPNDILNEIEKMYFRVPEIGNIRVEADPDLFPIVIMTNNSEKALPDAFLRRCIYYNIPFPDRDQLDKIVLSRTHDGNARTPLLNDALSFFINARESSTGLDKRPGTAELLNWITALQRFGARFDEPMREQGPLVRRTLSTLAKLADDQLRLRQTFDQWLSGQ
jgi:MoxR-like ATPase